MIEGVRAIGEAVLQRNPLIVDALVDTQILEKSNTPQHVIFLDLRLEPPSLESDMKVLDEKVLTEVLWARNAPGANSPQDRLTTDHVEYLVSQTIPNLCSALAEGELRRRLEELHQVIYLDLGEKVEMFRTGGDSQYERYRWMWDLPKLGLADLQLIGDKKEREELEAICRAQGVGFLTRPFLQAYAREKGKAKAAAELVGQVVEAWALRRLELKRKEVALYTLKLNDELLAQHPDYPTYLEKTLVKEAFEKAPKSTCHACGDQG
ncbi:hypothetical protein H5T53_04690, partial [Candidatus Bipolaricaulota bacterium]|nr:hypothetical protein [Candidatus Bipolaricaulota bacterium]